MERKELIRKIALSAILLSLSIIFSILDGLIPTGLPGVKLGLANLVILIAIYCLNIPIALGINIARILLSSLLTGSFLQMGFFMSLTGGLLSFGMMVIAKLFFKKLTPVGVSIIGSYFHCLGQIIVGWIYIRNPGILYYFPVIAIFALLSGLLIGILVEILTSNQSFMVLVGKKKENIE